MVQERGTELLKLPFLFQQTIFPNHINQNYNSQHFFKLITLKNLKIAILMRLKSHLTQQGSGSYFVPRCHIFPDSSVIISLSIFTYFSYIISGQ